MIKLKTKEWKNGYDVGFEAGKEYQRNVQMNHKGWKCEKCGAWNSGVYKKCFGCRWPAPKIQ